jgi:hypothetical protein
VKDGESPTISVTGATYLETFNLQNCSAYKGSLDFSQCPAITQILLTGSGVNSLTLPYNGILTELRLPNTLSKLEIDSH